MLIPITSIVIERLSREKTLKLIVLLAVFATFFISMAFLGGLNLKKMPVVFGFVPEDECYSSLSDWNPHNAMVYANKNLPAGSKIFLFRETRVYYLDIPHVIGSPTRQAYVDYTQMRDYFDLYNRLNEIGVTHIFINRNLNMFESTKLVMRELGAYK